MKILRARLKPNAGGPFEFVSMTARIKALIDNNEGDDFNFVIDEDGIKTVKEFGPNNVNDELVGKKIPIVDSNYLVQFNEDGNINVISSTNESRRIKNFKDFR